MTPSAPPSQPATKAPAKLAPDLAAHAVPIASVHANPANLKDHDERSVEAIAASLRTFGQQKPIVIDAAGIVIAGNGTLEAAKLLGWERIAAVRSDLAGVDRVGYAIADNRIAELSTWREELGQALAELPRDTALSAGYTERELDALIAGDREIKEDTPPAVLPAAVTRAGDVWFLGEHRLLCGDSTRAADVDLVLAGERPELVATDPPYLVDYTGERAGSQGKDWSDHYHEIDVPDAEVFFRGLFTQVARVMGEHAAVYCWHAHRRVGIIQAIWAEVGLLDHQQIIWVKPSMVPGRCLYNFQHEPCMVGWKQGSRPPAVRTGTDTSVWVAPVANSPVVEASPDADVWHADWEGKKRVVGNEHPTQKPVKLFAIPMLKHTGEGGVCFEPFSGSGTQLIAAEQLKRRCRAIEIEPVFVDVAIRRWQAFTGGTARLGSPTGPAWSEVRERRAAEPTPATNAGENAACPPAHPVNAASPAAEHSRTKAGTAPPTSEVPVPQAVPGGGKTKARRTRGGTGRTGGG